jgi:hypothetical protein
MPRRNWRPPSGLPEPLSPVAVEEDQGDDEDQGDQQPESRAEHVMFTTGRFVHLRMPDLNLPPTSALCGVFGKEPPRVVPPHAVAHAAPPCLMCQTVWEWVTKPRPKVSLGSGRR